MVKASQRIVKSRDAFFVLLIINMIIEGLVRYFNRNDLHI